MPEPQSSGAAPSESDSFNHVVVARCRELTERALPEGFFDLSPPDQLRLRHVLTVAREIGELPEFASLLDLPSIQGVELGQCTDPDLILLSPPRLERIDQLSDKELEAYTRFPETCQEALAQAPRTLPLSGDPELYSGANIRRFFERVNERVGDIDLALHIVRHDVASCSGVVHRNQPLHTITSFRYNGEIMGGPFCGSSTQYILRFCDAIPRELRPKAVEKFLLPLVERFRTFTIAFAVPQVFNTESRSYEVSSYPLENSQTFQMFVGSPLNFNIFQPCRLYDGRSGNSTMNHLYYFRGDPGYLDDTDFRRVLQAIREARRELRVESRAVEGFFALEARRNAVRADYISKLLG